MENICQRAHSIVVNDQTFKIWMLSDDIRGSIIHKASHLPFLPRHLWLFICVEPYQDSSQVSSHSILWLFFVWEVEIISTY